MTITTVGVVSAVTPGVLTTYIAHYLNRGQLKQKPTAHITYHEGLRLIRQFLDYASKHAVEDLQAFTAQWVPAPTWVKLDAVHIPHRYLHSSAKLIQEQLGPRGIELVGGKEWWQWRRPDQLQLRAEWIEMKKDIADRKRNNQKLDRVMLYIHGGAFFFGSVDEHRYQMQRHARKLKTRVLAPRYRLAPQFPFPCALQDCLAAYLFLLESFEPSQILVAGDSAGGGLVLSLLVTLRDQQLPQPAGGILLSPWVDLTHSFPSVAGTGEGDYIPAHGFHHKPSMVWPPPNAEDIRELANEAANGKAESALPEIDDMRSANAKNTLSLVLDGEEVVIRDQIQMYAPNSLLSHPLVSPVQQPSLGGLAPLLIQVGGAELLHDEQVYLAHKAANPLRYRPSDAVITKFSLNKDDITRYDPTHVQLQVWEDLCHVPHTLSFTRPAKYMYRAVAQFGGWALAHAQHKEIDIEDDANSIISEGSDEEQDENDSSINLSRARKRPGTAISNPLDARKQAPTGSVGKAGDPLPPFKDHMIRQKVDRHGATYPLTPASQMPFLQLEPNSVGAIKTGPVRKWLARKKETDTKFANEKKKVMRKRLKQMAAGYEKFSTGDMPPMTALAARRRADMPAEKKAKKSWALSLWAGWGWHHDEETIEREERMDLDTDPVEQRPASSGPTQPPGTSDGRSSSRPASKGRLLAPLDGRILRRVSSTSMLSVPKSGGVDGRPRTASRRVSDIGQADDENDRSAMGSQRSKRSIPGSDAPKMSDVSRDSRPVEGSENTFLPASGARPHNGTVAYPFKLRHDISNASTATVNSDTSSVKGDTTTSRSTPAHSMAPVESMIAEKEVIMPTYDEKEVVAVSVPSSFQPSPRPMLERMPSELAAHPKRGSSIGQGHAVKSPKPDTYSPTSGRNGTPESPVPETYQPRESSKGAKLPNGASPGRAGTSSSNESNQPKGLGFGFNGQRLQRPGTHISEVSAIVSPSMTTPGLSSPDMRPSPLISPPIAQFSPHPVELPAVSQSPTSDILSAVSLDRRPSAAAQSFSFAQMEPVELSTVKQTRSSILPPPRDNTSTPPAPATSDSPPALELSAVKQTRNSILPPARPPGSSQSTNSPLVALTRFDDGDDDEEDEADEPENEDEEEEEENNSSNDNDGEDGNPENLVAFLESPTFRPTTSTTTSNSTGRASSEADHESPWVRHHVIPSAKKQMMPPKLAPTKPPPAPDDDLPPPPPPKDIRFATPNFGPSRPGGSVRGSPAKPVLNGGSSRSRPSDDRPPGSSRSRPSDDRPPTRSGSKPPAIGDLNFGGGLGLT